MRVRKVTIIYERVKTFFLLAIQMQSPVIVVVLLFLSSLSIYSYYYELNLLNSKKNENEKVFLGSRYRNLNY